MTRQFPVRSLNFNLDLPWNMVAPYEGRAMRNHSQTLERLAERGGLSPREMMCVLDDVGWFTSDWKDRPERDAIRELERRLKAFKDGEWEDKLAVERQATETWKQRALVAEGAAEKCRDRRTQAEVLLSRIVEKGFLKGDGLEDEARRFLGVGHGRRPQ